MIIAPSFWPEVLASKIKDAITNVGAASSVACDKISIAFVITLLPSVIAPRITSVTSGVVVLSVVIVNFFEAMLKV
jgi:hypothetical protein